MPNMQRLQAGCRAAGVEVMYTLIRNLTRDGRDRSLDYKITGFSVPPGSWDGEVIDAIKPLDDEIVIPKTASNVFCSTNIDYILRNLGTKYLVISGVVTDQCVEGAVRSACDIGYLVTLITDACATGSRERHENSLRAIKGYCRQRTTDEFLRRDRRNVKNRGEKVWRSRLRSRPGSAIRRAGALSSALDAAGRQPRHEILLENHRDDRRRQ